MGRYTIYKESTYQYIVWDNVYNAILYKGTYEECQKYLEEMELNT